MEQAIVRVWDLDARKELCVLKDMEMVRSVRLSPDNKIVAADNKAGISVEVLSNVVFQAG